MSDIPVGSPPAPPGRHAAPSGWYADPVDPTRERWWDGWQWSRNTRVREAGHHAEHASSAPTSSREQRQTSLPAPRPAVGFFPGQATTTADGVLLAGWWRRAVAAVIDNLITSVMVVIIAFPVWRTLYAGMGAYLDELIATQRTGGVPPAAPTELLSPQDQAILVAVTLGVGMVYQLIFLRWRSATPGKLLIGLRVVPVDQGRSVEKLSWNAIGLRAAVWVLPGLASFLTLVSLLDIAFPLWHPKRQALHDLVAKTQVVRSDRAARQS